MGVTEPGRPEHQITDPDVDLHDPAQRAERPRWDLLAAIAVGGVIGAEARYGAGLALPHSGAEFPWSTLLVNVSGCLLIGVLMVVLLELRSPHRLLRPLLGVGVLGGYTTYSSFAVEVQQLVRQHRPGIALSYLAATVLGCAAAVWLSTAVTSATGRAVAARSRRRSDSARGGRLAP
jgi:fluoride exporter